MSAPKRSSIEWTDLSGGDANFVWRGSHPGDCKISPGCQNCYVDRIVRRYGQARWPPFTTFYPTKLGRLIGNQKLSSKPSKRGPGKRPTVFICDTGDLFHANVFDRWIKFALNGFRVRGDVVWQILTKRADRMAMLVNKYCDEAKIPRLPDNIWIGVSAETQHYFDERTEALAATRAEIRWVSIEPILGRIDITGAEWLDWVVVGGETGKNTRPAFPSWFRQIRDDCVKLHIPFFLKHRGQFRFDRDGIAYYVSRAVAGRMLDGRTWDQYPGVE